MLRQIALTAIITVAACAPAVARTIVDAAGRAVNVPDVISRVMPAGPPASVLLYVLAPEKLVSWVHAPMAEDREFLLPMVRSLPTTDRLNDGSTEVDLGSLLVTRPDIIIDVGTVNEAYVASADRIQELTGIPYVVVDGRLPRTADSLRQVGDLLGVSNRAEELAQYAEHTFETLSSDLASIAPAARPLVYYGRGHDGLQTGLGGSINLEVLDILGARNVAGTRPGGLVKVSPAQVRDWDPQVILAAAPEFAESARTDPRWAEIAAVRERRIYETPMRPFGWFESPPGVNRLLGIAWLKEILYPGAFDLDLEAEARAFFKLFYQVDLSDRQLATLLDTSARHHRSASPVIPPRKAGAASPNVTDEPNPPRL